MLILKSFFQLRFSEFFNCNFFLEFIEPLVVDYPPEIGDPDNSSSSPLQPEPDRLALHPKLEPCRLDTSQGSTGEGFTESGMENILLLK